MVYWLIHRKLTRFVVESSILKETSDMTIVSQNIRLYERRGDQKRLFPWLWIMSTSTANHLATRMRALGIAYPALSERTGISVPELKRVISGKHANPTLKTIQAIAKALGVEIRVGSSVKVVEECSAAELRERAAIQKAQKIVQLVQGTMALESQAVGPEAQREMITNTVRELLTGPPRRLWAS